MSSSNSSWSLPSNVINLENTFKVTILCILIYILSKLKSKLLHVVYLYIFLLFQCQWCPSAKLCSDGYDRNKQKWLKQNCDKANSHFQGKAEICSENIHNRGNYYPSDVDDQTNHIHETHQEYDHNDQKPFTDSKSSE